MTTANMTKTAEIQQTEHYTEVEMLIIGNCVFEGAITFAKAKCWISTPEVFYNEDYRKIWEVMDEANEAGRPIEPILIGRELTKKGKSISGSKWSLIIWECVRHITGSVFMQNYCLAAVEDYVMRTTRMGIYDLLNSSPVDVAIELDKKLKKAMDFKTVDDWKTASQIAMELIERREKIKNGEVVSVLTGYKEFDRITGGFESGFIVIAARPSMGKTAFATSLAVSMASMGTVVGILSLEMPNVQIAARISAIVSNVEFWRIFRGKHRSEEHGIEISTKIAEMGKLPLFVSDKSNVTFHEIRFKIERLVKRNNAKCVIIDYLQLVDGDGIKNETREREVAKLSKSLKALSTTLDIPIIALAQLNRESEKTGGNSKPGKLSQLRESGAIEQDVDLGIIIDRPWKRGEQTDESGASTENVADIIIEKFRNGETGTVRLHYDGPTMMFSDIKGPGEEPMMPDNDKLQIIPSKDLYANPPQLTLNNGTDTETPFD
jgi:replicative DNA helicase